MSLAIDQLRK